MIFALKSHGCGTQGSFQKFVYDTVGNLHEINYDLATPLGVAIRIRVNTRYNWPADGSRQIANLITAWAVGNNPATGKPNIQVSGDDKGTLSWTDVLGSFVGLVQGFDFVGLWFSADGGATWTADGASLPIPFGSFVEIASIEVKTNLEAW